MEQKWLCAEDGIVTLDQWHVQDLRGTRRERCLRTPNATRPSAHPSRSYPLQRAFWGAKILDADEKVLAVGDGAMDMVRAADRPKPRTRQPSHGGRAGVTLTGSIHHLGLRYLIET